MHTQEDQLAASSGGNSGIVTERINGEGIPIILRPIKGVLW